MESNTCTFKNLRKTELYEDYFRAMSVINASSKPLFKDVQYKKICLTEIKKTKRLKEQNTMNVNTKDESEDEYSDENYECKFETKEVRLANISPTASFVFSDSEESSIRCTSPVIIEYRGNFSNLGLNSKITNKIKEPPKKHKRHGDYEKLCDDISKFRKEAKEPQNSTQVREKGKM